MCPGTIHGCHYWTSWCEPQKASGHRRVASCRVKSSELHSCILHCTARRTPLAARFSSVVVTSVPCHFKQPSRFIKIPSIAGHVIWYASLTLARYINAYQCHCSIPIVYPLKVVWSLTFRWQMANGRGSSNASACLGLSFSWLHEKKTDKTGHRWGAYRGWDGGGHISGNCPLSTLSRLRQPYHCWWPTRACRQFGRICRCFSQFSVGKLQEQILHCERLVEPLLNPESPEFEYV